MVDFKFNEEGVADLKKQVTDQVKKAEVEANKAADRETTPEGKARVFARVLRKHGVENVNGAELRRKFSG